MLQEIADKLHCAGNERLLSKRPLTAFLCSRNVPQHVWMHIEMWAKSLDAARECVIIGCLGGAERYALKLLVERGVPVILALAEALPECPEEVAVMVPNVTLAPAMGAGQLLIASSNADAEESVAHTNNAFHRNLWMMQAADKIVVAYASANGSLSQQLAGRDNVSYLCR